MSALSLKTRMVLAVSVMFVSFMAAMAWATLVYFQGAERESVGIQQRVLAEQVAESIDDKFDLIRMSLLAAAQEVPAAVFIRPLEARQLLKVKTTLLTLCNAGIFLLDRDGSVVAGAPGMPALPGELRDLTRQSLATDRLQFSRPFASNDGDPLITLTAPVHDGEGRIVGVLGGTINLLGRNLFDNLAKLRIGEAGYLYLFDSERTLIVHPNRDRILKQDVPVGANRLFDLALAGFEGSGETVSSRGVPLLSTFRKLRTQDWILAVNFPRDEAYASIRRGNHYFLLACVVATALILVGVWLLMQQMTAPIVAMTHHVAHLSEKEGAEKLLTESSGNEIRTLARAFNDMLVELESKQQRLEAFNAELEERIAERTRLLAEANRELEAFNYSLSHDLRTPLNVITGYSQLLLDSCDIAVSDTCRDYLSKIVASGDRMEGLIEAMLTFSRIGQGELTREPVDLTTMAQDVVAGLRSSAPLRQVEVRIAAGLQAHGDPYLLRTVLENLLGNAWKYTVKQEHAAIEFTREVRADGEVFLIRDNGDGFDMAQVGKLFVPFQRLHAAQQFPGHGIGLATVQRIVARHGGRIWAEGEVGVGATFYFTLGGEGRATENG